MITDDKKCPCEAVRELKNIVGQHEKHLQRHDEQLCKGTTNFAVINTKLNIVLGVLAVVGTAVCGVVIKMMF